MSVAWGQHSSIPNTVQQTINNYLRQLQKGLDRQVESVMLYGSLVRGEYVEGRSNINLFVVQQDCSLENLQSCARLHEKWHKSGVIAPLVLSERELQQSFDRFPVEYFEIKDNHIVLEGKDPFLALHVDDDHLLQQCRREVYGNLFRLRQRFIEGAGRPEAVAALLPLSLTSLLPCLRGFCRVFGHPCRGASRVLLDNLPTTLRVDGTVFLEVLEVKQGLRTPGRLAWSQLFARYTQGIEAVIECVQQAS